MFLVSGEKEKKRKKKEAKAQETKKKTCNYLISLCLTTSSTVAKTYVQQAFSSKSFTGINFNLNCSLKQYHLLLILP